MRFQKFKLKKYGGVLLLTTLVTLLTVSTVYAVFVTINTDDGSVDPSWGSPFLTDPPGDASAEFDIEQVWVGTDASTPSHFYFRADLVGTIPTNLDSVEAWLDCDGNWEFDNPSDVLVVYWVQPGHVNAIQANDPLIYDSFGVEYGEMLADGNYEWRAHPSTFVDWTACVAPPLNVMFVTMNPSWNPEDLTTPRAYNIPTAVSLKEFSAQQPTNQRQWMLPLVLIVCAGACFILMRRRQTLRRTGKFNSLD